MVLTGGGDSSSMSKVTKYSKTGHAIDLPSLITGRYGHACGRVTKTNGETVSSALGHDEHLNSLLTMTNNYAVLHCGWRAGSVRAGQDRERHYLGLHRDPEDQWGTFVAESGKSAFSQNLFQWSVTG